jgi:hypothetical protein
VLGTKPDEEPSTMLTIRSLLSSAALAALLAGTGVAQAAECIAVTAGTDPDAKLTHSDVCGQGVSVSGDQNPAAEDINASYGSLTWSLQLQDGAVSDPFVGGATTTGSWGFDAIVGFTDYIITLKDGDTISGPKWVWFHIDLSEGCDTGSLAGQYDYCGTWTMYGTNGTSPKGISGIDLWAANASSTSSSFIGGTGSSGVPEPGSSGLALLGLGLLGASFWARKRKA